MLVVVDNDSDGGSDGHDDDIEFQAVAQAALEFTAFLLSQPHMCWDSKPRPPCPAA